MHFFGISGILLLCKTIQWWHHFFQALVFIPIAHAYVHNIWFVYWKMYHTVVVGQVVVQNSTMMYCIHNVYECLCQFHTISLKGNKLCSSFHIQPPLTVIRYDLINNGGVFRVIIQHFSKSSPIPPQCVCFHGLYVDGKEFDDTWMFAQACQGFPLIITYVLLTCHPCFMSSPPTQLCLGCDWIFQFIACTPHHNHPNCLHSTIGTHLLYFESITHHGF